MAGLRIAGKSLKAAGNALQRDLLTGEWESTPPKRGNGSHVRLKTLDGEKLVVPGMASYAGEGPAGKYCKDCGHFGEVAVQCTPNATEVNPAGCAIYAQHMRHAAPTGRRDIRVCAACKYFVAADEASRRFIIDQVGAIHRIENFPADLRSWRPAERDDGRTAPPDGACPKASRLVMVRHGAG
jgi:hypothetical protein